MITGTVLGEGAYGQVFKCTHRITDIEYAVKIVDKRLGAPRIKVSLTSDDRELKRFAHKLEVIKHHKIQFIRVNKS